MYNHHGLDIAGASVGITGCEVKWRQVVYLESVKSQRDRFQSPMMKRKQIIAGIAPATMKINRETEYVQVHKR